MKTKRTRRMRMSSRRRKKCGREGGHNEKEKLTI